MTFLVLSIGEWNKVENPSVILMSYEMSENEEEVEMALDHNENNNNNYNKVSNFESNEVEVNFFEERIEDMIEVTPKATLNPI